MKENKLMERIEELQDTNELYKDVINDILEDAKEYNGELQEQLETRLSEILEHGCVSGTVSSLVYYEDTTKFYETYTEEINSLLYESMQDTGLSIQELFGDKFDKEDPLCINKFNQNLLAWFGYEETARKLMYEVNPEF